MHRCRKSVITMGLNFMILHPCDWYHNILSSKVRFTLECNIMMSQSNLVKVEIVS